MDKESFNNALRLYQQVNTASSGIGTLGEKSLHRLLKLAYEPDSGYHEQPVGGFIADIANEKGFTEIQTRGLYRLKDKAAYMLRHAPLTVVYPLFASHNICYVDQRTGEASPLRRSPKKESYYNALPELSYLKPFFFVPGFKVELVLLEGLFYKDKSSKELLERVPTGYVDSLVLENREDFFALLPTVEGSFTAKELGKAWGLRKQQASAAAGLMAFSGVIERIGTKGRAYLYQRAEEYRDGR